MCHQYHSYLYHANSFHHQKSRILSVWHIATAVGRSRRNRKLYEVKLLRNQHKFCKPSIPDKAYRNYFRVYPSLHQTDRTGTKCVKKQSQKDIRKAHETIWTLQSMFRAGRLLDNREMWFMQLYLPSFSQSFISSNNPSEFRLHAQQLHQQKSVNRPPQWCILSNCIILLGTKPGYVMLSSFGRRCWG